MQALLAYVQPMVERHDFEQMRRFLSSIRVDDEIKARHLVEVSYAESLQGRYRNAHAAALLAFALRPVHSETRQQLAARLRTFNEADCLHQLIAASGPLERIPIPLLLTFAAQLSYLNEQNAAIEFLDEARRADPDYPPTLLARAQVLTYLGRIDEAVAELERCIGLAPGLSQAYWCLAHARKATAHSNLVDQLRSLLTSPGLKPRDQAFYGFALHKELDDLGEIDQAWAALVQGCAAKRSTLAYSPDDTVFLVNRLIDFPWQKRGGVSRSGQPVPIFIVGMHRSGTTLLEQMLDAGQQVHAAGELYDFTSAMRFAADHHCRGVIDPVIVQKAEKVDFFDVGNRYLEGIGWRLNGKNFFTDKLPSNFLNVGFICQALANAKILHMVRDPLDTCFSNLRELFSDANPYSYDQVELALFYRQYARLMNFWKSVFPDRILDVAYADLVREPEKTMRRVAEFCGLDYVPAMADPRNSKRAVATASAVQVRASVVVRDKPKWEPYAKYLGQMIAGLKDDPAVG